MQMFCSSCANIDFVKSYDTVGRTVSYECCLRCSLQLAVDVQIPEYLGGVGGEAIYIDTEGSFVVERAAEIAEAAVLHCQNILTPHHAIC